LPFDALEARSNLAECHVAHAYPLGADSP
jgi:hypothetical protein